MAPTEKEEKDTKRRATAPIPMLPSTLTHGSSSASILDDPGSSWQAAVVGRH